MSGVAQVLREPGVAPSMLRTRAKALKKLGAIFQVSLRVSWGLADTSSNCSVKELPDNQRKLSRLAEGLVGCRIFFCACLLVFMRALPDETCSLTPFTAALLFIAQRPGILDPSQS